MPRPFKCDLGVALSSIAIIIPDGDTALVPCSASATGAVAPRRHQRVYSPNTLGVAATERRPVVTGEPFQGRRGRSQAVELAGQVFARCDAGATDHTPKYAAIALHASRCALDGRQFGSCRRHSVRPGVRV